MVFIAKPKIMSMSPTPYSVSVHSGIRLQQLFVKTKLT